MDLKLISWNTNGRVAAAALQAKALLARQPDVVALQEVTLKTSALLAETLRRGGLEHVACSVRPQQDGSHTGARATGIMIASRHPLAAELPQLPVPWGEKMLSVGVKLLGIEVEVHSVHVPPGSSNGWIKVEVLEGIAQGLAGPSTRERILCGDFNTPQHETASGEIVTWAQRMTAGQVRLRSRIRKGSGARWDAAERNVFAGNFTDAFRFLHGYSVTEASWCLTRKGTEVGRRFDHILVSSGVRPVHCRYHHQWRLEGLSDHSAIEADLRLERSLTDVAGSRR